MNSPQLVAYLLDERRRRILNWRGIENLAGMGKGRIKNVCLYEKGQFRDTEIEVLNGVLEFLALPLTVQVGDSNFTDLKNKMEDKIIEVFKKYSKSVDTEYNVYNCLIEEDWSNIAQEVVKLFRQPAVMPSLPNGKRVLAALKELSDCFTDEERKTMFGNEA